MNLLGIDPGVKGAIAVFSTGDRRVSVIDMPDTTGGLHDAIMALPPVALCCIEKPFYPKIIGTANVAKIAMAYGKVISALHFKGIPVTEVRPVDWKAALNLSSAKSASREQASLTFPDDAAQWALKKQDGRAEASLLAWYGMRFLK